MAILDEITAATARDARLIAAWRRQEAPLTDSPDKGVALVDVSRALAAAQVRHALIGGVAVGIHSGSPRATQDTDLAITSTTDRDNVAHTLTNAGFTLVGTFAHSINFRHPNGEPVQLALDPGFDAFIAHAETFVVDGVDVPIVTKADLIAMKERAAADPSRRASKRLRDQADVALLREGAANPDDGW